MRSFCKFVTVMLALIGASIACALAPPAFAAKPASHRYYTHRISTERLRARPRASFAAMAGAITPMPAAGAATTTSILRITCCDGARAAAFHSEAPLDCNTSDRCMRRGWAIPPHSRRWGLSRLTRGIGVPCRTTVAKTPPQVGVQQPRLVSGKRQHAGGLRRAQLLDQRRKSRLPDWPAIWPAPCRP